MCETLVPVFCVQGLLLSGSELLALLEQGIQQKCHSLAEELFPDRHLSPLQNLGTVLAEVLASRHRKRSERVWQISDAPRPCSGPASPSGTGRGAPPAPQHRRRVWQRGKSLHTARAVPCRHAQRRVLTQRSHCITVSPRAT